MSRQTGFTATQKRDIFARDQVCVPHQGSEFECSGDLVAHHRVNRGMGGSKKANRVSNGLAVCSAWNYAVEQDARLAAVARFNGWKLKSYDDPASEAVYYPADDNWYLLDDDGNRTLTTPNEEIFEDVPF